MVVRSELAGLVAEAIAKLVNVRGEMIQRLLIPAGVSAPVCREILRKRDVTTGEPLTKRRMASLFIDHMNAQPNADEIYYELLRRISSRQDSYLAANEYEARAVVAKAQELLRKEDQGRSAAAARAEREAEESRAAMVREAENRRHRALSELLQAFDSLSLSVDHQQRGYVLQGLLERLLLACEIPAVKSFQRNEGAEQIDGALTYKGWHYLVECRWRAKAADIRDLDGLRGQVSRSGKQTMGVFLSIEGWSEHVPSLLRQNPERDILLVDGYDLRRVLNDEISLERLLDEKLARLNLYGGPAFRPLG